MLGGMMKKFTEWLEGIDYSRIDPQVLADIDKEVEDETDLDLSNRRWESFLDIFAKNHFDAYAAKFARDYSNFHHFLRDYDDRGSAYYRRIKEVVMREWELYKKTGHLSQQSTGDGGVEDYSGSYKTFPINPRTRPW
jgi:hypothetical protein